MDIVIASILAVGLLIGLVYILHRHQLSESQLNVDKYTPLPPLQTATFQDPETLDADTLDSEKEKTLPPSLVRIDEPGYVTLETSAAEQDTEAQEEPWLERISQLKKENRLDQALDICQQAFPLWSAYQQAALIHRAKVKEKQKSGGSLDEELQDLYKLAAMAELLHGRVRGLPDLSLSQLKLLNLETLSRLEMPYSDIGFNELRLIKKTDIRLLTDLWGNPETHQSPKEFHSAIWLKITGTQNSLF